MINVNNKMKNSKSEITAVEFRQSAEEDHVLIQKWKLCVKIRQRLHNFDINSFSHNPLHICKQIPE